MNLQVFSSQLDFIIASVARVLDVCKKDGQVYIAVSGGSTPRPLYEALATNSSIDFERIEWYLVDERYVSLEHMDSNYKMIMEAFGAAQPEFSEHFHFFNTALMPEEAARAYEEELKKIPERKFDLVFLGLGIDGHTASLFPGSPTLHEEERLATDTVNESFPSSAVRDRLTITWPMILGSREVVMLVSGKEKQGIIDELEKSNKTFEELPAKKLIERSNFSLLYLA
ncbi:MAG: 6-phosphogluconolactonase [Candidatus Magasanikbacteria bacterium]|nr:6-phosphogluconolactonase [Candidatus Magasanikbacteria bacterium]